MRVVSGTYKGHLLKTLKGDATRPTTMRVKESLFSAITSALGSLEGSCVLDGFAGSGALAGSSTCDLLRTSARSCEDRA